MTGPEHYRSAEAIVAALPKLKGKPIEVVAVHLAEAQVHATLALAAATAMAGQGLGSEGRWHAGMNPVDFQAWDDVCGVEGE